MDVMHDRVAGLDVHKAMIVACVRLVSGSKVSRECQTFESTTAGLLSLLAWLTASGCTHVAMEATGVYWKPVWNILSDGAFELILANAAHIKNVPGRKTDVNDATWLADLLAHGLIRGSFVPGEETQVLRSLLRTRKQLVRERSSHIQRLQKTLEDANIKLDSAITDIIGLSGRRMLEALLPARPIPLSLRHSPIRASKHRPSNCVRRCAAGSWRTTASCCGCTFSRSTPLMPLLTRSIARWKDVLPPFASPSNC